MNFEGWILVMNGGQVLVGKREDYGTTGYDRLSPVYDLMTGVQPGPQGVGIRRQLVPVMFADVPYVNLPESYAWLPVSALSGAMQRDLARGIEQAEELRGKIKLGDLGLAAPAGGGK